MLVLSDLRLLEPLVGSDRVLCSVCGRRTEAGWSREPSESFNAWDIARGGAFCEFCWAMLKHRPVRLHSWVGREGGIEFYPGPRLGELARFLLEPAVPCAVYLSSSHRKQYWIALGRRVSVDASRIWVATDWTGVVLVEPDPDLLTLAESLLARGVRRSSLRSGAYTPAEWRRALDEGWVADLERARSLAGEPRWEVWVHVAAR